MAPSGDDEQTTDPAERGVLTSLPSTRPQRPSPRRAAARGAPPKRPAGTKPARTKPIGTKLTGTKPPRTRPTGTKPTGTKPTGTNPAGTKAGTKRATEARRPPRKAPPEEPRIPRQGFETEEEIAPGSTVQPPSRPELAAAVADLLGELAQGGLTAGGRLLKDFLGRLPGV